MFERKSLGDSAVRFVLARVHSQEPLSDGWFRISWRHPKLGTTEAGARLNRLRFRGKWCVIRVDRPNAPVIFRRLSFGNAAQTIDQDGSQSSPVQIGWDDRIALLNDRELLETGGDTPLDPQPKLIIELASIFDWPRVIFRVPREGGEVALLAMVALVFALLTVAWTELRPIVVFNPMDQLSISTHNSRNGPLEIESKHELLVVDPKPISGWLFTQFSKGSIVISGSNPTDAAIGSHGAIFSANLDPRCEYVLAIETVKPIGTPFFRIDGGDGTKPNWISVTPGHLDEFRIGNASEIRLWIYFDEVNMSVSFRRLQLRAAIAADVLLPWGFNPKPIVVEKSLFSAWCAEQLASNLPRNDRALVQAVASHIYENSSRASTVGGRINESSLQAAIVSKGRLAISGSCFSMTSGLHWILLQSEIQSRIVTLGTMGFFNRTNPNDNHTILEYFDRQQMKWILVDPTFNIWFSDAAGKPIGLAELFESNQTGKTWRIVEGAPQRHDRRFADYYLPYADLLFYAWAPAVDSPTESAIAEFNPRKRTPGELDRETPK